MASESIPIDQPPVPTAPAVAIGENDAVFVAPPPTFPEKPQPDAPPRPDRPEGFDLLATDFLDLARQLGA